MGSRVLRVSETTKASIERIAKERSTSQAEVVSLAIEELERVELLREANEAYARLREDREKSTEFDAESNRWEVASAEDTRDL
ncbi:MAG: hypothetical protein V1748_03960 [Actinomycetota bacterium]